MVPSVLQKAIALLDHTILTVIIAFQFLGCLGSIATLLLFSRYPGADFDPLPLILFLAVGITTAVILHKNQKREFWWRLPALSWNALFAGYAILGRGMKSSSSGILTFNVCVAIYLSTTAAIGFAATRTKPKPEKTNYRTS